MPRSYVKKLKQWNNDDIKNAIVEMKCGKSIHKATSKHNMSAGNYIKHLRNMKRELIYRASLVRKQV